MPPKNLIRKSGQHNKYQDYICLGARTREEFKSKTEQVLRRLKQAGMTINSDKCKLHWEKISYLGYRIPREGISPDERLTNKTAKIEKPTNKKELKSLINFCSRYLRRYSELIEPFVEKNVEFKWTQEQNKAFEELKKVLPSKTVIKIFDPKNEVTLTTDASERAVAAVASQEGHPIMYLSRKLSSAECNYSNIEKEAWAIDWSMEKAQNFSLEKSSS